jgi:hypothetical protein
MDGTAAGRSIPRQALRCGAIGCAVSQQSFLPGKFSWAGSACWLWGWVLVWQQSQAPLHGANANAPETARQKTRLNARIKGKALTRLDENFLQATHGMGYY